MKGDFTRDTYRPERRYSSVRMQQGRVQLDADWNEAEDIRLGRERTEVRDVVGPAGVPIDNAGFAIAFDGANFTIGAGRMYVDGILVENPALVTYAAQPDLLGATPPTADALFFYLDVWEEHVTALEDPLLREVALNGPDTATRLRTVWQVKAAALPETVRTCAAAFDTLSGPTDARLEARAKTLDDTEACTVKPGSRYKRLENQLYRVEIHDAGNVNDATFKWSRDNGSVASGLTIVDGLTLAVDQPGRDGVLSFQSGGSIELIDRHRETFGEPGKLFRVAKVEGNRLELDPSGSPVVAADFGDGLKVRRWDSVGALTFTPDGEGFMTLEDGVQIRLTGNDLRTGDYWLIPARTVTGDVEWPFATPQPPKGIAHRFASLAIAVMSGTWAITDCRDPFVPLADMIGMFYVGGDGQTAKVDPATGSMGLPQVPTVGVARGKRPVEGADVLWTITKGGGTITDGQPIRQTDANGLVSCPWSLGPTEDVQQLRADLLDSEGDPTHIPVLFTAVLPRGEGSVGCCKSVGRDGDYPTILDAIMDIVFGRKEPAICLCLLPGEHEWPTKIEEEPPENFSRIEIVGLGDASVLVAKEPIKISEVASLGFVLRDLKLKAEGGIRLFAIKEFGMESVTLEARPQKEDGDSRILNLEALERAWIHDSNLQCEGRLSFEDVQTVSIVRTEASIRSDAHCVEVMGGLHAEVQDSVVDGLVMEGGGATLSFSGLRTLDVAGNEISARRKVRDERGSPRPPINRGDVVGGMIDRIGTELSTAGLRSEAKKLIGANAAERTSHAEAIEALIARDGIQFGRAGAERMKKLVSALRESGGEEPVVESLTELNAAARDPRVGTGTLAAGEGLGVALQLEDGRCIAHVRDNLLLGNVALYGDPGDQRMNTDQITLIMRRMLQSEGDWGIGSLHFADNYVAGIHLAKTFIGGDAFKELVENADVKLPVFQSAAFAGNVFAVGVVEVLASRSTMTANQFNSRGGDYGVVIANLATYTGNLSDNDGRLFSATRSKAEAGNLNINIV